MIQRFQEFPNGFQKVEHTFKNWVFLTLKSLSKVVVDFIESEVMKDPWNSYFFIKAQYLLSPYGISIDPAGLWEEELKIVKFWSNNIEVFLKMKKIGETPSLQSDINELVKKDLMSIEKRMVEFLGQNLDTCFTEESPVLFKFFEYFGKHKRRLITDENLYKRKKVRIT
ncbi:hypothetical protein DFH28DRAFT_977731 [Melampsora americana]|nr:hypothetical protein DFH28DRAFT_977731 [Melampsora americana]